MIFARSLSWVRPITTRPKSGKSAITERIIAQFAGDAFFKGIPVLRLRRRGRCVACPRARRAINAVPANNVDTCFSWLPLWRARRVKKICRWHIFSPSGKQAMLATRVEDSRISGCGRVLFEEERMKYLSLHREQVAVPPPSSEGGESVPFPQTPRLLPCLPL